MSSSLPIEVCAVGAVRHHPNADRLDMIQVKGWQCIVGRDEFKPGDTVVYVPPDAQMPEYVAAQLGILRYLKGGETNRRVGQIRLRGEASFGLVLPVTEESWAVGDDVADYFGITKWEPPTLGAQGDVLGKEHPLFVRYTDIENLRNFPTMFGPGESVVVTEKIHGTNVRIGLIEGEVMAGSHRLPRKRPDDDADKARSFYWYPWTLAPVRELLWKVAPNSPQIILFGETYGRVQNLHYGLKDLAFAAFDLYIDGRYLDYGAFRDLMDDAGVPTVPLLSAGASYAPAAIDLYSRGMSEVCGAAHMREGVVVRPQKERYSDLLNGRLIGKYLSEDYLLSKHHERDTKDV